MRSKHVLLSAAAAAYVVPRRRTPLLLRDSRQRFAFAAYDRGSRRQRSLVHDKEAPYVELASVRASYGRCLYPRAITDPADRGKMYRFFSMKKSSGLLLVLSGMSMHPRNPGTIHPRLRIARSSNPLLTFSWDVYLNLRANFCTQFWIQLPRKTMIQTAKAICQTGKPG